MVTSLPTSTFVVALPPVSWMTAMPTLVYQLLLPGEARSTMATGPVVPAAAPSVVPTLRSMLPGVALAMLLSNTAD